MTGERPLVAVISDIHGNLAALAAVFQELDRLGPSEVVVAGDLALGGPRPHECVDLIRRRGYPTIRGNTDEWLTKPPQRVTDGISWCAARLTADDRAFLAGLPFLWRREAESGDLVVVHATPWSLSDVIRPDAPAHEVRRAFEESGAAALVYGHIHTAYVRSFEGKLLVNGGSVGVPFDGDWRASFVTLVPSEAGWQATLRRVAYDREAVIAESRAGDNPEGPRFSRRLEAASF
jgi:putative phosphoesterase